MAKVSVIGAGSWGTALALLLSKNGHDVTMWSILEDEIRMLDKEREHKSKLPGVKLPDTMKFTTDLKKAVEGKDFLVLAVPSTFTRGTAKNMCPYVAEGQIIVDVAKGIEEATLMTLSQQIEDEIPQADVAVLSGPSHAEEVEDFRLLLLWEQRRKRQPSICSRCSQVKCSVYIQARICLAWNLAAL